MKQLTTQLLNRAKQMVYDRDKEGFTLIELIVVMAIIAILVLLAAPRFIGYTKDAEVTAMQQDIKVLSDAALQAHIADGVWPVSEVSHELTIAGEKIDGLKSLDEGKFKQYVKSIRRDYDEYALVTSSGEHEGKVFFIGNEDGLIDRHGKPHYGLDKSDVSVSPGETGLDDTPGAPGAPGPKALVAGNMEAGYFGTVSASELWDGESLAELVGVTEGISQYKDTDWLKFASEGKIIYRPMKPIRHTISWNHLDSKGVVFGDKEITHEDGTKYKVRLMKGVRDGIEEDIRYLDDSGTTGSEWNNLMMPIHENASDNSWGDQNTYHDVNPVEDWGIGFTDEDLHADESYGKGTSVWVQEKRSPDSPARVVRGTHGVSYAFFISSFLFNDSRGWAPVLEVVE